MLSVPSFVRRAEPLGPLTTLQLGGKAEYFVNASDEAMLLEALRWAKQEQMPVHVMGGGSNLVIADEGIEGLVVRIALPGRSMHEQNSALHVTASAGEIWDALVADIVDLGYAGVECLSGIPGFVGATPVQNVGAYGQEISNCAESIQVLDRTTLKSHQLTPAQCGFGYRTSCFKQNPKAFIVLGVRFVLTSRRANPPAYAELKAAFDGIADCTLMAVRSKVLELRRAKSMLIEPEDPNRRSVGSFFINPILSDQQLQTLQAQVSLPVPSFALPERRFKVPAAWLIEQAGQPKGLRRGAVGISTRHALALVHHGGGSTRELMDFARFIRASVLHKFGIVLHAEPTLWGPISLD